MPRSLLTGLFLCLATPGLADPAAADYVDDRSSAERKVVSLYNAIGRHEYLRAWSYFRPDPGRPYEAFRTGYEDSSLLLRAILALL